MKKLTSKVLVLWCGGWLLAFWLSYAVSPRVPDVIGNRPVAAYPETAAVMSPEWSRGAAAWAIERSPFRVGAISWRNRVWYEVARVAQPLPVCPGSGEVSMGREGWLFLLEDVPEGRSRRELETLVEQAVELARVVERSGRRFVLFPIPDKTSVYPEFTGTLHRWADRGSRRGELPGRMRAAFEGAGDVRESYVPLWEVFAERKAEGGELLYLKHDTHWSPTGRLTGVRQLIEGMQSGLWEPGAVHDEGMVAHPGELMTGQLLLNDATLARDYAIRREGPQPVLVSSVRVPGYGFPPIERYRCAHPRVIRGRTLMISDSFALGSVEEIAPWFEDITFAHFSYTGSDELVGRIRECETMVFTSVERFLRWRLNVWRTGRKGYVEGALGLPPE